MTTPPQPAWDDTIKAFFTAPYWIEESRRAPVAAQWKGCMVGFGITLDECQSVSQWAVTIYDHLYSRNMPLTIDRSQQWPDEALELLRLWVNQGCRETARQSVVSRDLIPPPMPRQAPLRIRKEIRELTDAELNEYRARLDAIEIWKVDPQAIWQQLAYVHTNWCLHYQEAFLLWHRAFLLYFENLIGFPIPYWNLTSPNAAKDGHPEAGLPEAFTALTYIHPKTGEERPNPLRFAVAKDGKSKACYMKDWPIAPDQCKYVQRDPVLYTSGDDHRSEREEKLAQLSLYQRQIVNAMLWPVFSSPQGYPGYPWANIQTFPAPDTAYPHRCDFDGLYEQPHDNVHGWLGPDMADNAFTAFDPIFWSHHSNLDRIFETWKREHPTASYTSTFPIRPFVGPLAKEIDFTDRRDYIFSTIGDLVRDCRALGYDYQSPQGDDITRAIYQEWGRHFYILFQGVKCTLDTYSLDIFLDQPNPCPQDVTLRNPHYVGQITRLGMGAPDTNGRCVVNGVTRMIDASYTAYALKLKPDSTVAISLIVTDVTQRRVLPPEEWQKLPGFIPAGAWGPPMTQPVQLIQTLTTAARFAGGAPAEGASNCCAD